MTSLGCTAERRIGSPAALAILRVFGTTAPAVGVGGARIGGLFGFVFRRAGAQAMSTGSTGWIARVPGLEVRMVHHRSRVRFLATFLMKLPQKETPSGGSRSRA